jgi:hemerythrin-like metal-binding protein
LNAAIGIEDTGAARRLEWSVDISVGNLAIDGQHRALFRMVNELIDAVDGGDQGTTVGHLDELIAHAIEHFNDEEQLLESMGSRELPFHRSLHKMLVERMTNLRHRVVGSPTAHSELILFLAYDLVEDHVLRADRIAFGLKPMF